MRVMGRYRSGCPVLRIECGGFGLVLGSFTFVAIFLLSATKVDSWNAWRYVLKFTGQISYISVLMYLDMLIMDHEAFPNLCELVH